MPLLPILFIATSSLEFSRVDFLLFLSIAMGQDKFLALPEKEEDACDVLATDAELEKHLVLIDQCSQRWSMPLTLLELSDPGNDEFVQDAVPFSQVLQKGEKGFVPIRVVVKAYTKLHVSPAVSVCVLQHLCCIVHECIVSCKTTSLLSFSVLVRPSHSTRDEAISARE